MISSSFEGIGGEIPDHCGGFGVRLQRYFGTSATRRAERPRINRSELHIDFMIGSRDVAVTGVEPGGGEVPLLRGGVWQI